VNRRLDEFLDLSIALTGFSKLHLIGTGVGTEYLETVEKIVPGEIIDQLLHAHAGPGGDTELSAALLDDATLGPVARNIIVLWYTGTWIPLPEDWCESVGRSAADVAHVVSSEAYLAGLQWRTIGAHPPGGLPPGFASWACPPPGV
jgi:hypothetical protein